MAAKIEPKAGAPKDLGSAPKAPAADPVAKGSPSGGAGGSLGVAAPKAAPAAPAAAPAGNRIEGAGGYVYEVAGDKLYIVQSPKHAGESIRLPVSQTNPGYSAIAAELARKGVKLPVAARGGVLDDRPMFNAENIQPDEASEPMFNADNIGPEEEEITRITLPSVPPYQPSRGPRNMSSSGIADSLWEERHSFIPESVLGSVRSAARSTMPNGMGQVLTGVGLIEAALAAQK